MNDLIKTSFNDRPPKAVILAGGRGTRLMPYTTFLPKPLMPIGDNPILEIVVRKFSECGLKNIIISVGHLAELITTFFGAGEKWGVDIEYVVEDKPLGTMGPLHLIQDTGENFFVMNGDILTDLDLPALYKGHVESGAIMTVATCRRNVDIDFGILSYDAENRRIDSFKEKPTLFYDVSMGIYVLSKRCLEYIPKNEYFGFDNLITRLLKKGEIVRAHPHKGMWLDIGRESDYRQANELMAQAYREGKNAII